MSSIYFNANSGTMGQNITSGEYTVVVKLSQQTINTSFWDPVLSAFIAPRNGVYRLSQTVTYSNGNGKGDGVIQGFSVNNQGPWPSGTSADLSTTNVTVLEPGKFLNAIAQSLEVILELKKGDTVQIALSGVDSSTFHINYSSLSVNSVDGL